MQKRSWKFRVPWKIWCIPVHLFFHQARIFRGNRHSRPRPWPGTQPQTSLSQFAFTQDPFVVTPFEKIWEVPGFRETLVHHRPPDPPRNPDPPGKSTFRPSESVWARPPPDATHPAATQPGRHPPRRHLPPNEPGVPQPPNRRRPVSPRSRSPRQLRSSSNWRKIRRNYCAWCRS